MAHTTRQSAHLGFLQSLSTGIRFSDALTTRKVDQVQLAFASRTVQFISTYALPTAWGENPPEPHNNTTHIHYLLLADVLSFKKITSRQITTHPTQHTKGIRTSTESTKCDRDECSLTLWEPTTLLLYPLPITVTTSSMHRTDFTSKSGTCTPPETF